MTNRVSGRRRASVEGGRQLSGADEQVVDESGLADRPDPAADVVTQQPLRVGLVVDLVADPDETIAAGTRAEAGDRVGDAGIGQVDPPDDPPDERCRGCRGQELAGLVEARAGLDEDGRVDAGGGQRRCEVGRRERPSDGCELVGEPRVVRPGGVPDVVVGVDDHRCGTGASAAMRPSARSSSQRSAGMGWARRAGYSSRCATERTPATRVVTAGWAIGNCIAAARRGRRGGRRPRRSVVRAR